MAKGFGNENFKKKINSKNIFYTKLIEQALIAQNNKDFEKAENIYQELIRLKVKNNIVYFNYGLLLERIKNIKKAEEIYFKAIENFPKDPNFYNKLALLNRNQGNYQEAVKLFLKSIQIDKSFENGYVNLANLYIVLKKNKKAEKIYRQVIKINPNSELGNLNLGIMLMDKGELKEAEELLLKTIKINKKCANAYFSLSKFRDIHNNKSFKKDLFNDELLIKQNELAKVNIFFARSNINHLEKNYGESRKNLILANTIKSRIYKSDAEKRIKFTDYIYQQHSKINLNTELLLQRKNYFFIVGMPRSGSTLVESIISNNENVFDLGETEALPLSYGEWVHNQRKKSLLEIYNKKINVDLIQSQNITDKNLSNYSLVPIILDQIKDSKIIYCYRNTFDNILSIYKANFMSGYTYSSSLIEISKVLMNVQEIMHKYKKLFPKYIYSVNYDSLVGNPESEIQKLIKWLNFKWDKKYLSPHLNKRTVKTTSKIQIRYPINNKSLSGWKNYKDLLNPVSDFFEKHNFDFKH